MVTADKSSGSFTADNVLLSSNDLVPGTVVDNKYHVLKRIGGGGMGQVYEAVHTIMRTHVALKVMFFDTDDHIAARRFRREARLLAGLSHPNIVKIKEAGVTADGLSFLIMELLKGETLREWVYRRGPEERTEEYIRDFVRLIRCIASGLAAAHAEGIIHRDIKLSNVVLHREGEDDTGEVIPKIIDFGIAKRAVDNPSGLTMTGETPGTFEYMAPEVIKGQNPTVSSDLYALGVSLYEGLTGGTLFSKNQKLCFDEDDRSALREIFRTLQSNNIPRAVSAVCIRLLDPNPDARFPDALASARALKKALPLSREKKASCLEKKHPARPAVIAGSLILLFGAAAGMLFFSPPPESGPRPDADLAQIAVPVPVSPPTSDAQNRAAGEDMTAGQSPSTKPSSIQPKTRSLSSAKPSPPRLPKAPPTESAAAVSKLIAEAKQKLDILDIGGAEALFQRAMDANPRSAEAWYGMGRVALEQNDYTRAKKRMENALKMKNAPLWRINLGCVLERMGKPKDAIAEWKRVQRDFPNNKAAFKGAELHLERHALSASKPKGELNEK